jgi:hypothetical protein
MAAKKSNHPDASALRVKESSFSGTELSLPMLGAATATQNFHATSISWHAHEGYELLMLLGGGALYEFEDGRGIPSGRGSFWAYSGGVAAFDHRLRCPRRRIRHFQ